MAPLENLNKYNIILASASPRRRQLLEQLGIDFTVKVIDGLDESYPASLAWQEIPEYLSRKKAEGHSSLLTPNTMIITADTLVMLDGKPLGKPADAAEARLMLHRLSGRSHFVITGVTILTTEKSTSFSTTTEVFFDSLTDDEIDFYITRFKPMDKAGAYGIQEWIGAAGIRRIEGSYYNVMGLPLHSLYTALGAF
ncbi:MAG: Maf family nucleotide pyrophosphatase [Muribaculaceae bacterium]